MKVAKILLTAAVLWKRGGHPQRKADILFAPEGAGEDYQNGE